MATLLGVVALLSLRLGRGAGVSPPTEGDGGLDGIAAATRRRADDPEVWAGAFVLLVVAIGGGTVVAAGEVSVGALPTGLVTLVVAGLFALLFAFLLFYGTYASMRSRGVGHAQAVGLGTGAVGLLGLLLIALQLTVG